MVSKYSNYLFKLKITKIKLYKQMNNSSTFCDTNFTTLSLYLEKEVLGIKAHD